MYTCKSGHHWWLNEDDAAKCCDPGYRRELVIGHPGEALPADTTPIGREGNLLYGRRWVKVENHLLKRPVFTV